MWPCMIFYVALLSWLAFLWSFIALVWTCMAFLWSVMAKYRFYWTFIAVIDPNSFGLVNLIWVLRPYKRDWDPRTETLDLKSKIWDQSSIFLPQLRPNEPKLYTQIPKRSEPKHIFKQIFYLSCLNSHKRAWNRKNSTINITIGLFFALHIFFAKRTIRSLHENW